MVVVSVWRRGRGILVIGPELAGRLVVFTLNLRGSIPLSLRIAPRNSGSKHPLPQGDMAQGQTYRKSGDIEFTIS